MVYDFGDVRDATLAIAARAANENLSPLDLMLAIMRDPHVALVTRVKMALRALPLPFNGILPKAEAPHS